MESQINPIRSATSEQVAKMAKAPNPILRFLDEWKTVGVILTATAGLALGFDRAHQSAMFRIDTNAANVVELEVKIDELPGKLKSMVDEHVKYPHPGAVSRLEMNYIKEALDELKADVKVILRGPR